MTSATRAPMLRHDTLAARTSADPAPHGAWAAGRWLRTGRTRALLLGGAKTFAFALAAVVALLAALYPDDPAPVDLARTVLPAPPGTWVADRTASGPLGLDALARTGAPADVQRRSAGNRFAGYLRVWSQPERSAQAAVFRTPNASSGAHMFAGAIDGQREHGAATFAVTGVHGARGFVVADRPTPGLTATQVAFRRGRLVFIVGVVAAGPDPALARTLAVAQAQRAPEGDDEPHDDVTAIAALAGSVTAAIAIYLLAVSGSASIRRRRSRAAAARRHHVGTSVAYVDVSGDVAARRRVERAAFTAKAMGGSLLLGLADPSLWPTAFGFAGVGLVTIACGIGLAHGRRWAANSLAVLTLVLLPLAPLLVPGIRAVLRGQIASTARSGGSRYRRLFTGRRPVRVTGLLGVASLLTTIGVVALVGVVRMPGDGESDARRMSGALACAGLAALPYRRARRLAGLDAASVVERDERAPILYLRSFGDDALKVRAHGGARRHSALERFGPRRRERFEEVIAGCLWAHGPVVAVGEPGERLAPIGAARTNLDDAGWRAGVETWMARAGLIVITVGRTAGLAWEVARVAEFGLWDRTVLLFPPIPTHELEDRWQRLVATAAQSGAPLEAKLELPGVVLARVDGQRLVAYAGVERDEWHYESALTAALSAQSAST